MILLLPTVLVGVTVDNEVCPANATETQLCSASQDFVLVLDVSYSRRPYFEDFKVFLNRFVDEIGLEGDPNGPRVHFTKDEFALK